jgi:hypothetical protein
MSDSALTPTTMEKILNIVKFILLSVCVLALSADAAENSLSTKPTWKWTVEERIKARTDPSSITERLDKRLKKAARDGNKDDEAIIAKLAYIVDGSDTPELILPTELWSFLMSSAFDSNPEFSSVSREIYTKKAVGISLPKDFWDRLAVYVAAVRKAGEPLAAARERRDRPAVETAWRELCHARAETLNSARAEFGDEIFLRFLYQSVANGLSISDYKAADPDQLRRNEEGCQ